MLAADFWASGVIAEALHSWHIGQVIRAYRHHPFHGPRPLSQELVASWLGLTQTQLSRIESGPPIKDLGKLVAWAKALHLPADLLWFKLPAHPEASPLRSPDAAPVFALSAIVNGRPLLLPINAATARAAGFDDLLSGLPGHDQPDEAGHGAVTTLNLRTPSVFTSLDVDELEHVTAALNDARKYLDGSVVDYFSNQLGRCKTDDGQLGPAKALPLVLGILGAVQQQATAVKPDVRRALLAVGAEGAEFAGWLYRDLRHSASAVYWYDRAMEWAQAANDTAMQGYILLKKSQMAYEDRDAHRVATLAEAAYLGPWQLPAKVRVEVIQQEARGLAMLGEPIAVVEQKLDEAVRLFSRPDGGDRPQFGTYFNEGALRLREASCYIEAGKPGRAASLFADALNAGNLSHRDEGYFRARRAVACALSGVPDDAAEEGLTAWSIAAATNSQRTTRELARTVKILTPWASRSGPRQLREALCG